MTQAGNKIALVTGAGTGVGRAASLALMNAGFTVVLAGRRMDKLEETKKLGDKVGKSLPRFGRYDRSRIDCRAVRQGDGRLRPARRSLQQRRHGRAAGAVRGFEPGAVAGGGDTNLTAPFLCTQHAFRIMKDQTPRGGRIINNGSISAHAPRPFSSAYTSTKHAITGLTKATNLDGRAYDIAVGQIDIGNAATPMTDRMVDGVLQPDGRKIPSRAWTPTRWATPSPIWPSLPLDANVLFMTVMASKMPFVGRG